ncbi:squalene synthetase-like protein [Stygiomarasmius scandens]|uniref:Squalene synthetase-like protein n=1 Tax=Marasmiellus scandens TaxID=2682957 RepID=A0ABR1J6B0_9AGAR
MSYRVSEDFYRLADDNSLSQFRTLFWGNDTLFNDKSSELAISPALADFCLLFRNIPKSGEPIKIYVRKQYKELYDYLVERARDIAKAGCIVIGSPGIGKSVFNLYALARRLASRKITIFTVSPVDKNTPPSNYILDAEGVFRLKSPNPEDPFFPRSQDPVWRLHDSTARSTEPSQIFLSSFLVFTVSPDSSRFDSLRKVLTIPFWYMEPWKREELTDFLAKYGQKFDQDVYDVSGPCIHDYMKCMEAEGLKQFQLDALGAIQRLNLRQVIHVVQNLADNELTTHAELSHRVFVCYRRDSVVRDSYLTVKSRWIHAEFLKLRPKLELKEAENLFVSLNRSGALAGFSFELLAKTYLSGNQPKAQQRMVVGDLQELEAAEGSRKYTIGQLTSADTFHPQERKVQAFHTLADMSFTDEHFYLPVSKTNLFFDAVAFETTGKPRKKAKTKTRLVVWVFQFSVTKMRDTDSNLGYSLLDQIREQAEKDNMLSEFRYVLVVPVSTLGNVSWQLPADETLADIEAPEKKHHGTRGGIAKLCKWIPGKVFVQYLHI